jgi:hypothetical protein
MSIVINLTLELEEQLRKKATHQGQDISLVSSESMAQWTSPPSPPQHRRKTLGRWHPRPRKKTRILVEAAI